MSFHINSDKEKIRGVNPKLIGDNEATIRIGSGASEREVFRAQVDANSGLPRIGINRTGQRVNNINVTAGGSGYTLEPTVVVSPPPAGGVQALASAFIFQGQVISVVVNEPGSGYTTAPTVTFSGGNGAGADAEAFLDTVDFELDINGAIRTSTSIISDTARILNLDIENFVTPDLSLRAPNLKTYLNGGGIPWAPNVIVAKDEYRYFGQNVYQALNSGETDNFGPVHADGIATNNEVQFKHVGFRTSNATAPYFLEGGDSGIFPRSITPLLGDRSDKIATTEYVLNLATNDVGGRIYVSQQIGSDLNDGRSAVSPVRTIKKAAQLAWATPGIKETLIVSGGDYVEDNPISLPPDCSVVGDNLRLVIIRPNNPGKHIFKFGDKNYVTGVTYRDKIDSNGDPVSTWDFAMVFDDKQRLIIDNEVNGDFGVDFRIGHQIFGPTRFRVGFQNNTGLAQLTSNIVVTGLNTASRARVIDVVFDATSGASAYISGTIDIEGISGSFVEGEQYSYITGASQGATLTQTITETAGENALKFTTDPTVDFAVGDYVYINDFLTIPIQGYYQVGFIDDDAAPNYWIVGFVPILNSLEWDSTEPFPPSYQIKAATADIKTIDTTFLRSIRAEGEVVSIDDDIVTTLPITRIDFSLQGNPEIATGGFQSAQFGDAEDLGGIVFYTNPLVGRTNTHDFKEGQEIVLEGLPTSGPDLSFLNGKQRIYKVLEDADGRCRRFVIPKKAAGLNNDNFNPGVLAKVKSYSKAVTVSLLNSPNKFALSTPVDRRYQDACVYIRNNRDFIADEVVRRINDEFKKEYFDVYDVDAVNKTFKVFLGTSTFDHTYISGGTVTFNSTDYNITDFDWDNISTGVATITTSTAVGSLADDDIVKLANILVECENGQKLYPSFSIPVDDNQCRQDIVHFLNALVRDLEFGSNHNILEAGQKYVIGTRIDLIDNEIVQTVRAIEYARELAIYAMCNWRTGNRTPGDPIYSPLYSTLDRYFDDSVITATAGTPACDDVRSAIDTLSYLFVDVISNDASGRYLDAAYLIGRNKDLIAHQALLDTKTQYPTLGLSNTHERKCQRDIGYILRGLIRDLILGGNAGIVESAEAYFTGLNLSGIDIDQIEETRYAYSKVRDYAIAAMRNWTDGDITATTPSTATYDGTTGVVTVTFPTPPTAVTTSDRIAFAEGALTFSCTSNGGGNLASPTPTDRNYGKSLAITNVSTAGGNTTVTCNVGDAGTAAAAAHTFVSALSNGTFLIFNPTPITSVIPKFEDWNVLYDNNNPNCVDTATTITTLMGILDGILEYAEDSESPTAIAPGSTTRTYGTLFNINDILTYPDSYIYDFSNRRMAVRGTFDDYPIIEASPYTQNASVISFLGGSGALIDGSKVKQPNCPFPGLELDGTASYPNQGKSMVAAAFTIVSFGGTGYKIIEDGYVQLVSVFVIFCADGVLCESGGYASITNSATNFGIYALRGSGYRREAYSFDVATVDVVSQTPTGRTTLTVSGLGREPLEHYVLKVDGFTNQNPDTEYFIDSVSAVTVGPPFTATITLDNGTGDPLNLIRTSDGAVITGLTELQNALTPQSGGVTIRLHRPSIVNSSSHTWEFAGSGTNYLALPENGGTKVEAYEQVSENYGRTYVSGTDELGDFKVGTFARIENRTGNITFTGTVTISEVEFLKLKGGDVVVTGFDASNTLGGANSTDSKLPTQKAVRDYITNNLGPYINKPYSTNPVPRALVELTDSGKINISQIPPIPTTNVYTVDTEAERLALEGLRAGDIAIEDGTSYILNNDLASLYVTFAVGTSSAFTFGNIYTGNPSTGRIQATEYRTGVVYQINITNGGSGYVVAPTVTLSGGNPAPGAVAATATCTIAGGQVVTVTITENPGGSGYYGGYGYTTAPTVTFSAPAGAGVQATGIALIEDRLYGDIVNRIKIEDTDTFLDDNLNSININRVVNTSANDLNNWVSLSTTNVAASNITSGVIDTARLAIGGAANSFTYLRGDQNWALAVQSLKGAETRYFAKLYSQVSLGSSTLIFTTNSNTLKGHTVVTSVAGIPNDTSINGVVTTGGLTTVSISKPVTAAIAAGTIIEFQRGQSPLTFESSYTQGSFIDQIIIQNGGSGYTNGQYFNVGIDGGSGTELAANIIVSGGAVTEISITNSGTGYTNDFTVTPAPVEIGSGTGLVLLAKVSTINRQYANVAIDIQRVSDLTISSDAYGTIGVSRFKKSQFKIGEEGNGSIEIKTGPDSGLDADLLDGKQGNHYTNASNLVTGTVPRDRLAGTYDISITGQSSNTIRLVTSTQNESANSAPQDFNEGAVLNTLFNTADSLSTAFPSVNTGGSTRHITLTLRAKGSGAAVDSGVRQLAFADDNSMYLRGSGAVAQSNTVFGSWAKVWSSGNHGVDSGLDADKLDNKQGNWYQDGWNIIKNELFDTRMPRWMSSTKFRDKLEVKTYSGADVFYRILVRAVLPVGPGGQFAAPAQVNLFDINKIDIGDFFLISTPQVIDANDSTKSYTMLIGRLASGGNITNAVYVGFGGGGEIPFENYEIYDSNTYTAAELGNSSGNGYLTLGRNGTVASSPFIYFRTSAAAAPNYNVALIASGGTNTDGSGNLEIKAANENALTLNGSVIWNASNVVFNSTNVVSTASLKSAVVRDTSGNFSAGTITASLTGAASLNVLKAGDTMTGALAITGVAAGTQALSVSGRADFLAAATVAADLTVDTDTLYVDSTNNKVNVGSTTSGTGRLNIIDSNGSTAYVTGNSLSAQTSQYKFTVHNTSTGGESGVVLRHGSTTAAAEWGISVLRSADNVGSFIIRTRTAASTNATRLTIANGGDITPGANNAQTLGSSTLRWSAVYSQVEEVKSSIRVGDASANAEADIQFKGAASGAGGGRNWRVGNNIGTGVDVFEIKKSSTDGGIDWNATPAIAIQGATNRVAINTTAFGGTDTTVTPNVARTYALNLQGDININGSVFQNNAEFVTSRWTAATNLRDIYRLSKVGIMAVDPTKELVVGGDVDIVNGDIKGDNTLTGGIQYFSPGYFGVDRAVTLDSKKRYGSIRYRRVNTGVYYWWVLFVSPVTTTQYTTVFAARIKTPPNGTVGEILECNFEDADAIVGSTGYTSDFQSNGVYYLAWLSSAPGYTAPTGAIYADASSGGQISYVTTTTAPSVSQTYTTTSGDVGSNIHIQVLPKKASLQANGFEQWIDSYGLFKKCKQTIDENLVINNGEYVVSFGDITISSGKVVTIQTGGIWTIN